MCSFFQCLHEIVGRKGYKMQFVQMKNKSRECERFECISALSSSPPHHYIIYFMHRMRLCLCEIGILGTSCVSHKNNCPRCGRISVKRKNISQSQTLSIYTESFKGVGFFGWSFDMQKRCIKKTQNWKFSIDMHEMEILCTFVL
jgi:hypothetical protein